eukprot:TRINITY_DN1203_c0_g2_i1.p1 TRINITY_DN1203_c0_g2~~TRINITY_DN1203_c0_g2_i1.p1  ORF type:complete len:464 (-),score=37.54 TRINITY_DN1203_c0_g2_i1:357-1748(-)
MSVNEGSRSTTVRLGFSPQTVGIRTQFEDRSASFMCGGKLAFLTFHLTGYGLSTLSPLMQAWARMYTLFIGQDITIEFLVKPPDQVTAGLLARDVKFAVLDDPSGDEMLNRADGEDVLVVPSFAHGMSIGYNIPELNPLQNGTSTAVWIVTGQILADIFMGVITSWSHPYIAAANPRLQGLLPNKPIMVMVYDSPVYYTELFTDTITKLGISYSSIAVSRYTNWTQINPTRVKTVGLSNAVSVMTETSYSIGYINHMVVVTQGNGVVQEALVENKQGNAVGPTSDNVQSALQDFAANGIVGRVSSNNRRRDQDNLTTSLAAGPGKQSYPFSSLGYLAFHTTDPLLNRQAVRELLNFVIWTQSFTDSFKALDKFGATNLTGPIQTQVLEVLATIKCNNIVSLDIATCLSDGKICSNQGICLDGTCLCRPGYSGTYCSDDGSLDMFIAYIVVLSVGVPGICLCCV